ncbi:hybrid sensor histidine kinase/response regulator [Dongshaea marina]|uniref:hypothetical protein n=1 Tax=Dongshaea marina TaxID=2047966 RepID=UPI000D3E32BB|nr:hypothetical protein [Dongshaea marina]
MIESKIAHSLGVRLTVLVVLLVSIFWIIAYVALIMGSDRLYASDYIHRINELRASSISAHFRSVENDVGSLSRDLIDFRDVKHISLLPISHGSTRFIPFWNSKNESQTMHYAQLIARGIKASPFSYIGGFIIYDDDWLLLQSSSGPEFIHQPKLAQFFTSLWKVTPNSRGYYWGRPHYDPLLKFYWVPVARKIMSLSGKPVLVGVFFPLSRETKMLESYNGVLTSRSGNILLGSHSLINGIGLSELLAKERAQEDRSWFSAGRFVSSSTLQGPPWLLIGIRQLSAVNQSELRAHLMHVGTLPYILIPLLLLMLSLLLILHLRLVRPLRRFTQIIRDTGGRIFSSAFQLSERTS